MKTKAATPDWLAGTVLLFDQAKRRRGKWDRKVSLALDLEVARTERREISHAPKPGDRK